MTNKKKEVRTMNLRREFLKACRVFGIVAGGLALFVCLFLMASSWSVKSAHAVQSPQIPLLGSTIPQFVQPLPILSISPFVNPAPPAPAYNKSITTVPGNVPLTIRMCEFKSNMLPATVVGYTGTWVWGYLVDPNPAGSTCATLVDLYDDGIINGTANALNTYTGPVIVNGRTAPGGPGSTDITWVNDLGLTSATNVLAYKYSTDQTLHWADPLNDMCNLGLGIPAFGTPCVQNYAGPIPAVVHLHGGEVPAEIDGGPDSWFTSDGTKSGHKYYSFPLAAPNAATYKYPNTQEAAPIWFHDHTLGATRLNVYMGLAGVNYIADSALIPPPGGTCVLNCLPANLQPLTEVIPLVIQDRMFDTNFQLFFPADSAGLAPGTMPWSLNPEHPYWVPEFIGDTIAVNGKVWPFLDVQEKRYRFLFLNGSNARTYNLRLAAPMWVIGTDGGYLDTPVSVTNLLMQPGERYEVIIDFAGRAGRNLIMTNNAAAPYPMGILPTPTTVGRIIQFRVARGRVPDASYDPGLPLRQRVPLRTGTNAIVRLPGTPGGPAIVTAPGVTQNVQQIRQLTLNEVLLPAITLTDPVTGAPNTPYFGGPLELLVNNTKFAGIFPGDPARNDFTAITVGGVTTYFSELPREGNTEIWEIVNMTIDAHPIHLHLVQFQLINRQNFNAATYSLAYNTAFGRLALPPGCLRGAFCAGSGPPLNYTTGNPRALGGNPDITPYLMGRVQLPATNERGWKDTVIALPGQVTRFAMRYAPTSLPLATSPALLNFPFDPSGGDDPTTLAIESLFSYVWHCHIIDHEDNEMMRPSVVQLNPLAPVPSSRPLKKGIHY